MGFNGTPSRDWQVAIGSQLKGLIPGWITDCAIVKSREEFVVHLQPGTSVLDQRFRALREKLREEIEIFGPLRFAIHKPDENLRLELQKEPAETLLFLEPQPEAPRKADDPLEVHRLSNEELFSAIIKTLPLGVEMLRPLRYRMALDGGTFDFLVLKLAVPEQKETALKRWRAEFEEQYKVSVLVERSRAFSGAREQLKRWAGKKELLTAKELPRLRRYLKGFFGKPPSPPRTPPDLSSLEDHTAIPFLAIDPAGTAASEDLVYAVALPNSGNIRLSVALIDVTPLARPGDYIDRYAERIGATIFGTKVCIPTLGPEIAYGAASFKAGETRPAWLVELELAESGKVVGRRVTRALVKCAAQVAPSQVNYLLQGLNSCPLNIHYLRQAASKLHANRLKQKKIMLVEGDGLGGMIVGETMLAAKSALANFMLENDIPAIFKVHTPPTVERKQDLIAAVRRFGIEATVEDFDDPQRFASILQLLGEEERSPERQKLLQEILDVFLTRSRYDTVNRGHFGIGVDAYLEIKPRDAAGLTNQFQLLKYFKKNGEAGLSPAVLAHRAARRNRQVQERATVEYKLRFFEKLQQNLSMTGRECQAAVREIHQNRLLVEVDGFTKWGVVMLSNRDERVFTIGQPLRLALSGFSVEHMRFLFKSIVPAGEPVFERERSSAA